MLEAVVPNGAEHAGSVGGVGFQQHVGGLDDLKGFAQLADIEGDLEG